MMSRGPVAVTPGREGTWDVDFQVAQRTVGELLHPPLHHRPLATTHRNPLLNSYRQTTRPSRDHISRTPRIDIQSLTPAA
jgi:hypothetical protein